MATSRITTKEQFENIRYQAVDDDNYESGIVVLQKSIVGVQDWVTVWELVWSENNGRDTFSYYYEEPNTPYQEGSEAEFDASEIVEAVGESVVITRYTRVYPKKGKK